LLIRPGTPKYYADMTSARLRDIDDAGFNSYGWEPPDGSEPALCALIRAR